MAEWLKALAWNASIRQKRIKSSNLFLSAIFAPAKILHFRFSILAAMCAARAKSLLRKNENRKSTFENGRVRMSIIDKPYLNQVPRHIRRYLALSPSMAFTFENLDVYKRALQFATSIESLLSENKNSVNRGFNDQLSRASLSIPLNIAEGNGRWHQADKRQFFWVARGSVFECVPLIEILKIKNCISDIEYKKLRTDLDALGKMLTKLVQAHSDSN